MKRIVWQLAGIVALAILFVVLVMVGRIDLLIVLSLGMVIGYYARFWQKAGKE